MNAAGDANRNVAVPHGAFNTGWHFIYFGYSRALNKATMFI